MGPTLVRVFRQDWIAAFNRPASAGKGPLLRTTMSFSMKLIKVKGFRCSVHARLRQAHQSSDICYPASAPNSRTCYREFAKSDQVGFRPLVANVVKVPGNLHRDSLSQVIQGRLMIIILYSK